MRPSLFKLAAVVPLSLLVLAASTDFSAISAQTTQTPAKTKVAAKVKTQAAQKKLVDLNKASADEMVEILPGVGEVTAKKIVDGRPYTKVEDLAKAGVPNRTIEGIRSLVTVSAPAPAPAEKAAPAKKAVAKAKTAPAAAPAPAATPAPAPAAAAGHHAKVNLNTASLDELQTLPNIGPVHAKEIVALRPIKKLSDLEKIKGLSKDRVEELDEYVVILAPKPAEPAPAPAPAAKAAEPVAKAKAKVAAKKAAPAATPTKAATGDLAPGQTVNINKASQDELQLLPGIGPVKSQAIIEGRPYKTKEDIMKVKGIKHGSFAKIENLITVD